MITGNALGNPFPRAVRTIGVFAPAGVAEPARLERGLARLRGWGLEVALAGPVGPAERFLAASDERRACALNELLRNPQVDVLLAARGGYGCGRILEMLDLEGLKARAIPLIGYSDVTALHAAAFARGCRTHVAGPMVCNALSRQPADEPETGHLAAVFESLRRALAGEAIEVASLRPLRVGRGEGLLLPANLSVLTSLVGTPFLPDLSGVILVLEDVGEAAYRVDRYLNQLRQAGCLQRLAGLVLGQFTEGDDAQWLPEVFADFARHVPGPVVAGLEFGHGFPSMSLPVGRLARLQADADGGRLAIAAAG